MKEIIFKILMRDYAEAMVLLPIAYIAVVLAVGIDLVTGIRKARRNGERIHSTGLKRSCGKLADYLLPMFVLSLVDLILIKWIGMPVMTMLYGAFCIGCEVKSIMERSWEKKRLREMVKVAGRVSRADMPELIRLLIELCEESDSKLKLKDDNDEKN